jgi:hypothetical protein
LAARFRLWYGWFNSSWGLEFAAPNGAVGVRKPTLRTRDEVYSKEVLFLIAAGKLFSYVLRGMDKFSRNYLNLAAYALGRHVNVEAHVAIYNTTRGCGIVWVC